MMKPRKLLSLLLACVMLCSLLPSTLLTASAEPLTTVHASTAEQVKQYLESNAPYRVILDNAIEEWIGSTQTWCDIAGEKELDLAGHDFTLHADIAPLQGVVQESFMFYVPKDAKLTVFDSELLGSKLHYDGKLSASVLRDWTNNRSIFQTRGSLILNNVCVAAGRAKSVYNPLDAEMQTHCIYGTAVWVSTGGYLEVNNSTLIGYCNPRSPASTATVYLEDDATVRFNGGRAWAYCGGDIFRVMQPGAVIPHVETVVLLRRENIDDHLAFTWTAEDFGTKGSKATYSEIQAYISEKFGLQISHLNIAQIKRKCGIIERENYNLPKSEESKQPPCTKEREVAIMDAFRHFKLI